METSDVFISYKREAPASQWCGHQLHNILKVHGYSVFFDQSDMHHGNWETQLDEHINSAKDVIVLLEEVSLANCRHNAKINYREDWFCKEIIKAISLKKNIIPLSIGSYDVNALCAEQLPPEMALLQKQQAFHVKGPDELADVVEKQLLKKNNFQSLPAFAYYKSFLDAWKQFQQNILKRYNNIKDVDDMCNNELFEPFKKDISFYNNLHNLLSHENNSGEMLAVNEKLLQRFQKFSQNFQSCAKDKMTSQLLVANPQDLVGPILLKMVKEGYSYVPVLDENMITWGVFRENTMMHVMAENHPFSGTTKFEDLKKFIAVSESSASYRFVSGCTAMPELLQLFKNSRLQEERLDLLIVTSDGAPTSPVLGILTMWDLD